MSGDIASPSSWECHRCGSVNAPHVSQCTCSRLGMAPPVGVPWGEPYVPTVPAHPFIPPGFDPTPWVQPQYTFTATVAGGSLLMPGACASKSMGAV